jgi:hypothetical protein
VLTQTHKSSKAERGTPSTSWASFISNGLPSIESPAKASVAIISPTQSYIVRLGLRGLSLSKAVFEGCNRIIADVSNSISSNSRRRAKASVAGA